MVRRVGGREIWLVPRLPWGRFSLSPCRLPPGLTLLRLVACLRSTGPGDLDMAPGIVRFRCYSPALGALRRQLRSQFDLRLGGSDHHFPAEMATLPPSGREKSRARSRRPSPDSPNPTDFASARSPPTARSLVRSRAAALPHPREQFEELVICGASSEMSEALAPECIPDVEHMIFVTSGLYLIPSGSRS